MPPPQFSRYLRGLVAPLAVAIVGVLGLDTTALVAAPSSTTLSPAAAAAATTPATGESPLRLIFWSGQVWIVVPPDQTGPHGDPASDSTRSVYVDSQGRLHLSVYKSGGIWRSVRIESLSPINYGTYEFTTDSSISTLAKPLDFAMFVYRAGSVGLSNEIDLEDSRALLGMKGGLDAQYVVQPYYRAHHTKRYAIGAKETQTRQQFTWTAGKVSFVTHNGASGAGRRLSHFSYSGPDVPMAFGMHVYIELFLHDMPTHPNVKHGTKSAILDSFNYTPAG